MPVRLRQAAHTPCSGHSPLNVDADTNALAAHDLLVSAAREAGAVALKYLNPGARTSAHVVTKAGGSPVTEADLAANSLLKRRLQDALPDAGWLSEETVDDFERLSRRSLIIVDPIDGTRAFVTGDLRWVVSVALIVDERPLAGVVYAPALDEIYAAARGAGATFNGAAIMPAPPGWPVRVAAGPKLMIEAMAAGAWRHGRHRSTCAGARLPNVPGGPRGGRFRDLGRRTRMTGISPPPISCSRNWARGWSTPWASGSSTMPARSAVARSLLLFRTRQRPGFSRAFAPPPPSCSRPDRGRFPAACLFVATKAKANSPSCGPL